ncbi:MULTISPECIES: hypothetical protein [Enterobacteriaceae]|nr:hypothetical protein [Enterobacter hormaechei]
MQSLSDQLRRLSSG